MQRGFIGLITILMASAVALLIGSTILLKSITEATLSLEEEHSNKAWATVNACAEYGLLHLALASTTNIEGGGWDYSGDESISVGSEENLCYIYPIIGAGEDLSTSRTINASSTVNDFTRKLSIVVATNTPAIEVTSWTEVADF